MTDSIIPSGTKLPNNTMRPFDTPTDSSSPLHIPSDYELREELQRLVLNDLLGPAGGPEEEIDERAVSDRYLVGMLAPARRRLEPQEFDELGLNDSSPYDGPTDTATLPAESMFPSSFGLTFAVAQNVQTLRVTTRWGHYERKASTTIINEKSGSPKQVWKRTPVEGTRDITLREGNLVEWEVEPEVLVRGRARRTDREWLVTLFLVNGQEEPKQSRDQAWLFQPELIIEAPDGSPIFQCYRRPNESSRLDGEVKAEQDALAMIYRHRTEFTVGHGVSTHAETNPNNITQAWRICTRAVPQHSVPQTTPPTAVDIPALADLVLDMKTLSETADSDFATKLGTLTNAYAAWIQDEYAKISDPAQDLSNHETAAKVALNNCSRALERIREGIALLGKHKQAAEAFRFANRSMWLQRTHSLYAEAVRRGEKVSFEEFDVPVNRSWRPFQLAFVLLNLPSLTLLHHEDRSDNSQAIADLLWFPTGGGKTEAYLGLTAYTLGIRRLQGVVEGRDGQQGVAVLMRYTLRLLTLQQFQRAAALICACESIRREALERHDWRWGGEPFRLGLWVGAKTTPNTTAKAEEAIQEERGQGSGAGGGGTPAQLTNCPWCGSAIEPGKHIIVNKDVERTLLFCGDKYGRCLFSAKQSPDEGIPAMVVDSEIYRRLPALLIATVDKFAQMPWQGTVQTLFGRVNGICPRHGFRAPEIQDAESHNARNGLPAVKSQPHGPLRPPDLIIQDELHLISGPLGTLVGLYETAIDELCAWQVEGKRVRPKVIASTATIRNARRQIHSLFLRHVEVFPPQGTDVRDNFFSLQRDTSPQTPGRNYIGICAPGKRLKVALIRVYVAYLSAAETLYSRYSYGLKADPWMTLCGYFSSMRELGGMRRLVDDDVATRLWRMDERGLAKRARPRIEELTSRRSAADIPKLLDQLEVPFDPSKKHKPGDPPTVSPIDVLLATNMISVGVDVRRLGLMVVAGQPKSTSEYIQATSRVGRSKPGLVCTVFNWARPRDLSHYEGFEHYHATFYQHVEALSVTPFSSRALDRGLSALLVSLVRLAGEDFNPNSTAANIDRDHETVKRALQAIVRRATLVEEDKQAGADVLKMLEKRLDVWASRAGKSGSGSLLGYRDAKDGVTKGLLEKAGQGAWQDFTCLNSLRDVEPMVNLILQERGMDDEDETFEEGVEDTLKDTTMPTPVDG